MKPDRVEVSRDESGKRWVIRIQVGAEVIRRHSDEPKDAAADALRDVAARVAADEGYQVEPSEVLLA
jgi:flagellar motor protein MotB